MALERVALGSLSIVYERSVFERRADLREWLDSPDLRALAESGLSAILALGGDGTLLRAVRAYAREGLPFLGLHFGNKGFLMHESAGLDSAAGFERVSYPLLANTLSVDGETVAEFDSLNDTVIKSEGPSLGRFELSLGTLAIDVACDGMIVSTPLGSTGYARAVGGPILPHSAETLVVAPIAPFEPAGLRPVVCSADTACRVLARHSSQNTLSVYSDAETIARDLSHATLDTRVSSRSVTLLVPAGTMPEWRARPFVEQGFSHTAP